MKIVNDVCSVLKLLLVDFTLIYDFKQANVLQMQVKMMYKYLKYSKTTNNRLIIKKWLRKLINNFKKY